MTAFNKFNTSWAFWFLGFLFTCSVATAQKTGKKNESDAASIQKYLEEARFLIAYLEATLNELGNDEVPPIEKNTIVKESYIKIFQDSTVQIEDDLDENRDIPTNKDVQAYLQDVDYFFRDAKFHFTINDISNNVKDDGTVYILVEMERHLEAITIDDDTVNSVRERYVELNLDQTNNELKIASFYTTKLSKKDELYSWWNELSDEWKEVFASETAIDDSTFLNQISFISDDFMLSNIGDTIPSNTKIVEHLEKFHTTKYLDVSGNLLISDLSPISKMRKLESINISDTNISDLMPLRSLTKLKELYFENTLAYDLSPLRYCLQLEVLVFNNTMINDLEPVINFERLKVLQFNETPVQDLSPLEKLENIQELWSAQTSINDISAISAYQNLINLNIANTAIHDLNDIQEITSMEVLNISDTDIDNLDPLAKMDDLKVLIANNTKIDVLTPLYDVSAIENIYCDNTGINAQKAKAFTNKKPKCLVVYGTDQLKSWWNEMPENWQSVFKKYIPVENQPSIEQLQAMVNLKIIDISNNQEISTFDPLARLISLKEINAQGTAITNISSLRALTDVREFNISQTQIEDLSILKDWKALNDLNISNTPVKDISSLEELRRLSTLDMSNTQVSELSALNEMSSLKSVNCDDTQVSTEDAKDFAVSHPSTLLIFRTELLNSWWAELDQTWKGIFKNAIKIQDSPNSVELHKIGSLEKLNINGERTIKDLSPIRQLFMLKNLDISQTRVNNIAPVSVLSELEKLNCSETPLNDLTKLGGLKKLKDLNLAGTQVDKLDPIASIKTLEKVNISDNIRIKKFKALSQLSELTELYCNNTNIKSFKDVQALKNLKYIRCYNTKLKSKTVDKFREAKPDCEVDFY
ncbi:leucine-rich repeat domain-containing protein [Sediminitomix flava]|uniref:Leucine-rich repeat (LRR) protein n=1 Tax=Sediminitomix flava TaxID=379075 RepID=A0A315Z805_SEDFL|nr:leucine-rich repeat domain-containing protein [Sediminitomix flava]PWJ40181.1 hypothetical protein BC781_105249 [Sediminitomix flava]